MRLQPCFVYIYGVIFALSNLVFSEAHAATVVLPANDVSNGPKLIGGLDRGSAAHNNLATASFEEAYTLGLSYSMAGDQMAASIVDTSRPGIGGAIYYSRRETRDLGSFNDPALGNFTRMEQHAVVGLSAKLGEGIAASVSGKYRYLRPYSLGLVPTSFWTIDVGLAAKLSEEWMLGLAAKDLMAQADGLNFRSFEVSIVGQVVPGLELLGQVDFHSVPNSTIDTGFVGTENKPSIKFGANYNVNRQFELFGHYANLQNWDQSYTALGLGYSKDKYKLQYGFRFSVKDSSAQYHMLAVSMNL